MPQSLETAIAESFEEYQRFRDQDCHYSAIARLAEIENCSRRMPGIEGQQWSEMALGEAIPEKAITEVHRQMAADARRIEHILSIGNEWNDDELTLILTLRITLELVQTYLERRGIEAALDLERVDTRIREVASSAQNKRVFNLVVGEVRDRWAIESRWLYSFS